MSIEIQKPALERRVREGIQSGRFQDVDDLLTKAMRSRNPPAAGWGPSIGRSVLPWKAYPEK